MKAQRNFHVPLPEDLYERLRHASERAAQPATVLAREAIAQWLEQRERERLAQEIAQYAAATAGGAEDLDEDLEEASLEVWTETLD